MANVGKFLLVVLAVVGLYALPNIVSECPEGREWSCVDRLVPADEGEQEAQLIAVSADGETAVVLSGTDGDIDRLDLWSLDEGQRTATVDVTLGDDLALVAFSADGSQLLVADSTEGDAAAEVLRLDLADGSTSTATADDVERMERLTESRTQILDQLDGGELLVQTVEGDWYVDIDTTERWTATSASFTEARADAFILLRSDSALALPRILRKHPSRIQILDIDEEDVTMDIDLPSSVVDAQWSGDGDSLVAVDADGVLTIFAREADR